MTYRARTGRDIGRRRRAVGVTQAALAERVGKSQSWVSRLEQSDSPLSDRARGTIMHALEKAVDGAATVLGNAMGTFLPKAVKTTIVKILEGLPAITRIVLHPESRKRRERALTDAQRGKIVVDALDKSADALEAGRPEDAAVIATMAIELCGRHEPLQGVVPMLIVNGGTGLIRSERFEEGRELLERVLSHEEADQVLRGLAVQELGMSEYEESCKRAPRLTPSVRASFLKAEGYLDKASELLPRRPSPGVGLLHLANALHELGDRKWVEEILTKSARILRGVRSKDLDYIRGAENIRKRFPSLSRRRNLMRTFFPFLFTLAVLLIAPVGVEMLEEHVGARVSSCVSSGDTLPERSDSLPGSLPPTNEEQGLREGILLLAEHVGTRIDYLATATKLGAEGNCCEAAGVGSGDGRPAAYVRVEEHVGVKTERSA